MGDKKMGLLGLTFLLLQLTACDGGGSGSGSPGWPIAKDVYTTAEQQVLPVSVSPEAAHISPGDVAQYADYGYSAWETGPGLPYAKRTELAPAYTGAANEARLLSFFTMSDIHLTDKESPAQAIFMGLLG